MPIKLSSEQTNALVREIVDRIQEPAKAHNEAVEQSKEYQEFINVNVDCKLLTDLEKQYDLSYMHAAKQKIRTHFFKIRLVKVPYVDEVKVRREIVLATIDAKDLDSLIEKVSTKFVG